MPPPCDWSVAAAAWTSTASVVLPVTVPSAGAAAAPQSRARAPVHQGAGGLEAQRPMCRGHAEGRGGARGAGMTVTVDADLLEPTDGGLAAYEWLRTR